MIFYDANPMFTLYDQVQIFVIGDLQTFIVSRVANIQNSHKLHSEQQQDYHRLLHKTKKPEVPEYKYTPLVSCMHFFEYVP